MPLPPIFTPKEVFSLNIPTDPMILLSFVNTKLRDFYPSLNALCEDLSLDCPALVSALKQAGYEYDPAANQFR